MLLTPEIITINLLNLIFSIFLSIAFVIAIKIVLKWDIKAQNELQYKLLKQNYLIQTIIKIVFFIKLPLFLFFIYTLDSLAPLIPGAMCGVGVVNAVDFGNNLLIFKILNLYLFGFWLVLNKLDNSKPTYPYTKLKYILFIFIFFIFLAEVYLEFSYFNELNPNKIVTCCSTVYNATNYSLIGKLISLDHKIILSFFYFNYIFLLAFYKKELIFAIFNVIFIVVSLVSLISFFGIYIYELPTHHCPFCLLQSDYYYIGYFIYLFLFLGTFFGISSILYKAYKKFSIIFNTLLVIILSYYPISYYLKNGVWL